MLMNPMSEPDMFVKATQLQIRYSPNPLARYVDLFEDHPQASANADVLTAYLGWVLNVGTLVICQSKHPP